MEIPAEVVAGLAVVGTAVGAGLVAAGKALVTLSVGTAAMGFISTIGFDESSYGSYKTTGACELETYWLATGNMLNVTMTAGAWTVEVDYIAP